MALKFKLRLLRLSAKLVLTIFHVCVNKLVDDDDDEPELLVGPDPALHMEGQYSSTISNLGSWWA